MKKLNDERIFSVSIGQRVLLVAVLINLFVLSFFMVSSSRFSSAETKVYSLAQSTSTSIVFTQRETLAFTTKFAQWIGGQVPKRDVQITRAFLAQRLSVVTTDGRSTGELVDRDFMDLLKQSDSILEHAPDGILPESLQPKYAVNSVEVIDGLLYNSRLMIVTYQQKLDEQLLKSTEVRSRNTLKSLLALISLITLTSIFLLWGLLTFRIQYNAARRKLHDEEVALLLAESRLKEAETTVKTLEDLNKSKNDFISTVNHELRTPLTSIIGYIDILKTLDVTKDAAQFAQITSVIDRNSEVLLDIIESILSLSSMDSPAQMPRFEETDLAQSIDRKIFVMKPLIDEKSLIVNFYKDPQVKYSILGNGGQMSQVVLNLLSNAIKFSPDKGVISVSLSVITKEGNKEIIQLAIKDQGMGIPKEDIPKLFTRFYRASNAVSGQIVGTGLGLAIVGRILDLHKATIRVESEVNKGSSFIVEFPRFVSEVNQLISKNRSSVLYKAIVALKSADDDQLIKVCHEMSGALGFYELEPEMNLISDFQKWVEGNLDASGEVISNKKEELISLLEDSFSEIADATEPKP